MAKRDTTTRPPGDKSLSSTQKKVAKTARAAAPPRRHRATRAREDNSEDDFTPDARTVREMKAEAQASKRVKHSKHYHKITALLPDSEVDTPGGDHGSASHADDQEGKTRSEIDKDNVDDEKAAAERQEEEADATFEARIDRWRSDV